MRIKITSKKKFEDPLSRTTGKRETKEVKDQMFTSTKVPQTSTVLTKAPNSVSKSVKTTKVYTHRDYLHLLPQIKVDVVFFDGVVTIAHASFKGTHNTYLGVGVAKKNDIDTVSFNKGKAVAEGLAAQAVLFAIAKETLPQNQISRQAWMRIKNTNKIPADFPKMPISQF